ncbi:MAG: right-handed parallel beta-helix repeat-containing protein [Phycisphaerales bacterium]|nr:right-handed parallel beta-helix repeat-containing protein [Phycisphaerales bacterium]
MNASNRTVCSRLIMLAALAGTCVSALAGPLNPPGGPITSTYKTINEVEPRLPIDSNYAPGDADAVFKISSSGSYYATGSVTIFGARAYLEIAASNVTVDLNGFRISGSAGTIDGIFIAPGVTNVRIRNGSVVFFSQDGIDLTGVTGCVVEDVTVSNCSGTGIRAGQGTLLTRCIANNNGGEGFNLPSAAVATECTARANSTYGFFGSGAAQITHCGAHANGNSGIYVTTGSLVSDCTASSNGSYGIGMVLNADAVTITNNSCNTNTVGGILVAGNALVKGNSVTSNPNVTNILLTGSGARVEGNTTRGTGFAVSSAVGAADNFVIGNWHYSGNGSNGFSGLAAATNVVGPVVTTAGTITTTNPWANFTR